MPDDQFLRRSRGRFCAGLGGLLPVDSQKLDTGLKRCTDDELNIVHLDFLEADDARVLRVFVLVTAHRWIIDSDAPRRFAFSLFEGDMKGIRPGGIALGLQRAGDQEGIYQRDLAVLVAQREEEEFALPLLRQET